MSFILGYKPSQLEQLCSLIQKNDSIKGVIFFKRNIDSLSSLAEQITSLSQVKKGLKFCLDFEGGKVNRLTHLGFPVESALTIGKHYDCRDTVESRYSATYRLKSQLQPVANTLKDIGINTVFGPCIDKAGLSPVIAGFSRSYSQRIQTVGALSEAFIESFEDFGIECVIKHFPSHAMALGDTHFQCAIDLRCEKQLEEEICLYQNLIEKYPSLGLMLSHCIFHHIDSTPVSLSSFWHKKLTSIKTNNIYTDCLDMEAVTRYLNPCLMQKMNYYKIFSTLDQNLVKRDIARLCLKN